MAYIKDRIHSFRNAFRGVMLLFRKTPNARIQLVAALLITLLGISFRISRGEWLALVMVIGLVFAMEAINTALEVLADYASNHSIHPAIRDAKDLAAAGVLIVACIALVTGLFIFLPKFF